MHSLSLLLLASASLAAVQYQLRVGGNQAGIYTNGYLSLLASGPGNALAVVKSNSSDTYTLAHGVLSSVQNVTGYYAYADPQAPKASVNFGGTKDSVWGTTNSSAYTYLAYAGVSTFAVCNISTALNVVFVDRQVGAPFNGQNCTSIVLVLVPAGLSPSNNASMNASAAAVAVATPTGSMTKVFLGPPLAFSSTAPSVAAASVLLEAPPTVQATATTQVVPCDCASGYTSVLSGQIATVTSAGAPTVVYGLGMLPPCTLTMQGGAITTVLTAPATVTLAVGKVTTITAPATGAAVATYVPTMAARPVLLQQINAVSSARQYSLLLLGLFCAIGIAAAL